MRLIEFIEGEHVTDVRVLDLLAEGMTPEEIAAEYAPVTVDDVRAAINYAATLAYEQELIPLR